MSNAQQKKTLPKSCGKSFQKGIQNIRGYYDRDKLSLIQVANIDMKGEDGVKGWMQEFLFHPAISFNLLEYMIIWCKIQAIINIFFQMYFI